MIKLFILLIAVTLICGDTTQPKNQNRPRILFLGNQIIRGINDPSGFGFRDHVQELLGVGVWDYVGPSADPESHLIFDVHHAGRDGDWASLVRDRTPKLLEKFMDPKAKNDWVLIHMGTIDILKSADLKAYEDLLTVGLGVRKKIVKKRIRRKMRTIVKYVHVKKTLISEKNVKSETVKLDIEGLIENISAFNPHIRIALAKIIPCRNREYNVNIKELNSWMEEAVQMRKRVTGENNLFLVDMYKAFITTPNWGEKLMSDRWYPNEQGYELMAREWVRVIKQANAELAPGGILTPNDR